MNKIYKYSATALVAASLFALSAQTANAATGYQRLTHNAYAYTYTGKRANHRLYRKGNRVKVIGSIELNGKKYNIIAGNLYIKAANFSSKKTATTTNLGDGYETTMLHNAYIYNSKGKRVRGKKLLKNHDITYYGKVLMIKGKKYVQIGDNQYVRSSNVLLAYDGPISSNSNVNRHATNCSSNNDTSINSNNSTNNSTNNSKNNNVVNNTANSQNGSKSSKTNQTNNQSANILRNGNQNNQTNTDVATDTDFEALSLAIQKAEATKYYDATFARAQAYHQAKEAAEVLMVNHKHPYKYQPVITAAEVHAATANVEAAAANLDGDAEYDKMPNVKIERATDGDIKYDWTPAQKQLVLDIANEIHGSTDAHYFDNDRQIGLTDGNGMAHTFNTSYFLHETY